MSSGDDPRTLASLDTARGGTLFLDDVGNLPRELQGTLLQLLTAQSLEELGGTAAEADGASVRLIAATHRDLEAEVSAGRFRDDLFYRLNVVTIVLPPLRARRADLAGLTDYLLARLAARYHRDVVRVSSDVRRLLAAYCWPGNVRELMNVLERAVILSRGDVVTSDHLPDRLLVRPARALASPRTSALSLEELERRHIERILAASKTLAEAATRLGINPTTLWRKRQRYRLVGAVPAGPSPSRPRERHIRRVLVSDKPASDPGNGSAG